MAKDTLSNKAEKNEKNLDKGVAKMFKKFLPESRKAEGADARPGVSVRSSLARLARSHLDPSRDQVGRFPVFAFCG